MTTITCSEMSSKLAKTMETAYLLRSPKNARRLIESIAELDSGGGKKRKLMELRNLCKRTPSCR